MVKKNRRIPVKGKKRLEMMVLVSDNVLIAIVVLFLLRV